MTKVERLKLTTARKEFEAWVNNPFMTAESTRPDSWCPCSKRDLEEWELAPYDHPWANGAWEAWKKFNNFPNDPDQEDDE